MTPFQQILALQTKVHHQVKQQQLSLATNTQLDALKLAQGLDKPKLMALLYQNLGQILEQKGEVQKTVYAYEAAFKALNKEDHQLEMTSRKLRRATKSFQRVRKIEIPDVYSPTVAASLQIGLQADNLNLTILLHIGNSYFAQPQLLPALNAYEQVLAQANIDKWPLLKAQTLIKVGEIFRQQKKTDLAQEKVKNALILFKQHGIPEDERFAIALQARLHFQAQAIDQAIPAYQKTVALFEGLEDYKNAGKIWAQMGQLYLGTQDFPKAKSSYEQALKYAETTKAKDLEWHLFWGLGCCHWEAENWEQAAIYFEKSKTKILIRQNKLYTDEGKVAFLDSVQDVFNRLIQTYLHIGTKAAIEKAFVITETAKGQALSDLMQGRGRRRAQQKTTTVRDLPPIFTGANNPIQQMSSSVPVIPPASSDDAEFNQIITALEEDQPQTIMQQSASGVASSNAIPDFSFHSVNETTEPTKKLPVRPISKRCFLSFYSLTDKLLIWLKKPNGELIFHQWKIAKVQLTAKIEAFRTAMMQDAQSRGLTMVRGVEKIEERTERAVVTRTRINKNVDFPQLSKEFYQQLWQPFQAYLTEEKTTVVVIPHDVLWLFPFAALKTETEKYIGTQHTLLYSPSMKALAQIDGEIPYSSIQDAKALIVGNPIMSQADKRYRFSELKGAEAEAIALSQLFQTQPLLQSKATQQAVEEGAINANILHLATHGMADETNPLESFIVLADLFKADGSLEKDGILKAREIMHWSVPAELVNLSACQTALGKVSGEGIIGLSRAFLVAGSRSVLVSLWNISDTATAAFMQQFYQYYLASGNKGLALQQAMENMQEQSDYAHAVYWAGFTLVGSDD